MSVNAGNTLISSFNSRDNRVFNFSTTLKLSYDVFEVIIAIEAARSTAFTSPNSFPIFAHPSSNFGPIPSVLASVTPKLPVR